MAKSTSPGSKTKAKAKARKKSSLSQAQLKARAKKAAETRKRRQAEKAAQAERAASSNLVDPKQQGRPEDLTTTAGSKTTTTPATVDLQKVERKSPPSGGVGADESHVTSLAELGLTEPSGVQVPGGEEDRKDGGSAVVHHVEVEGWHPEEIGDWLDLCFDGLAALKNNPDCRLSDNQRRWYVKRWKHVLDKWVPQGLGPELMLLAGTAAIVLPKLRMPTLPREGEEEAQPSGQ